MKRILLATLIALLPASTAAQKTPDGTTFSCDTQDGIPVTVARTPNRDVPLLHWNAPDIDLTQGNPLQLCQQTAEQLQANYSRGEAYLTTGNYCPEGRESCRVYVCTAQQVNGGCSERLFALHQDSQPKTAMQRIFRIRDTSSSGILETPGAIYLNLEQYLNRQEADSSSLNRSLLQRRGET